MAEDIETRFIKGLKDYDLTYKDIIEGGWYYCGGNKNRHLNYWNMNNQLRKKPWTMPQKTEQCVCGHKIVENCYITNNKKLLTLGNCCIKRFIPHQQRMCFDCKKEIKRKTEALCYECSLKRLLKKEHKTYEDAKRIIALNRFLTLDL